MPGFPGWNTISGAHSWENAFFWGSIIALILLGVMEVASHRAAQRKDELTEQQQAETQRRHDDEMARLHLQAAELTADAEKSRAAIAEATARAAEANKIAEEERLARVKLEASIAPRALTQPQRAAAVARLQHFPGIVADIWLCNSPSSDAPRLADALLQMLLAAKWDARGVSRLLGLSQAGVVVAIRTDAAARDNDAATALVAELNSDGIDAALTTGVTNSPVEVLGAFVGNVENSPPANVWVIVGSKAK